MKNIGDLIILAGGKGSRLGKIGKIIPKPLMPVYDEPIIIRQLKQLRHCPFDRIIISTNSENLKSRIELYLNIFNIRYNKVRVIVNPGHKNGTLSALNYLVKELKLKNFIMSFSDIYFLENPFSKFRRINFKDNFLIGCKPRKVTDLVKGGIIFTDKQRKYVKRIIYPPIKDNKEGYQWSGLAKLNHKAIVILEEFLKLFPKAKPEEEFIQFCIDNKLNFRVVNGPQFVNINSIRDIYELSKYRVKELRR